MEATRVVRGKGRPAVPEQPAGPPAGSGGRRERGAGAGVGLSAERMALVALVFGGERASGLLEGLAEPEARRARELLVGFAALSSARRQARVAVEFGVRPEAASRLRALMAQAPEVLREEIFRRLPPYHRSLFPERQVRPPDASVTGAVGTWAERLIREATR